MNGFVLGTNSEVNGECNEFESSPHSCVSHDDCSLVRSSQSDSPEKRSASQNPKGEFLARAFTTPVYWDHKMLF